MLLCALKKNNKEYYFAFMKNSIDRKFIYILSNCIVSKCFASCESLFNGLWTLYSVSIWQWSKKEIISNLLVILNDRFSRLKSKNIVWKKSLRFGSRIRRRLWFSWRFAFGDNWTQISRTFKPPNKSKSIQIKIIVVIAGDGNQFSL